MDIQLDQMEGASGVTRRIIDELHCSDMIKWKVKVGLFEVLRMILILWISEEIK